MRISMRLGVVLLGMIMGALIVVTEPATVKRSQSPIQILTGIGRADDPLDAAWALRTGQTIEIDLDEVSWELTKQEDGSISALEIQPNGEPGRTGTLIQQGRVVVDP